MAPLRQLPLAEGRLYRVGLALEAHAGLGERPQANPDYGGNPRNQDNPSGALDNAPISGHWFQAQFAQLLANANPPVS